MNLALSQIAFCNRRDHFITLDMRKYKCSSHPSSSSTGASNDNANPASASH